MPKRAIRDLFRSDIIVDIKTVLQKMRRASSDMNAISHESQDLIADSREAIAKAEAILSKDKDKEA